MTAASSIWRIRLSCSTTGPTSNWKALAIAVLLRLGDFLISRRLNITGFRPQRVSGLGSTHVPLGEEAESCKRCRAGPAPVWNNCETETGNLAEIKALFFALIGGAPGAEVVLLNQNLAVRPAAVLRDFHAHFLGTLPHRLLDLIEKARDRLRPVKLNDDVFGGIGASADPARGAGPAAAVQHMLDRMSRILGRIGDRRATGDIDLAGGPAVRCRIGFQRSLAKSREVRHSLLWHLFSCCCDPGFIAKKWEGRPCEDPTPCGPDPRPASR